MSFYFRPAGAEDERQGQQARYFAVKVCHREARSGERCVPNHCAMRKIAVCGAGYVGLVTAACLASLGHDVVCYDIDENRIADLAAGGLPIFEPGLAAMMTQHCSSGTLWFTAKLPDALSNREVVFIAVGTPAKADGTVDSRNVFAIAEQIALYVGRGAVIVNKSTVPVDTSEQLAALFSSVPGVDIVSNPEFLREGTAVQDFLHPDRIVIGTTSKRAVDVLNDIYAGIDAPLMITDARSAEMAKHASNAFLATKISFANEIAALSKAVGADTESVLQILGADRRIGSGALRPGLGYGGSCLPKDLATLRQLGLAHGTPVHVLEGAAATNASVVSALAERMRTRLGPLENLHIAVFGLSFKGGTDDVRCSPAVAVIEMLRDVHRAQIAAYDPVARAPLIGVELCDDPYRAADGAHGLVIATAWESFKELDLPRIASGMKTPLLFDTVGALVRGDALQAGFALA